jgi:hypothetical protein
VVEEVVVVVVEEEEEGVEDLRRWTSLMHQHRVNLTVSWFSCTLQLDFLSVVLCSSPSSAVKKPLIKNLKQTIRASPSCI